jgi:HTH-type transcriptional regulator / antitoxin HigA
VRDLSLQLPGDRVVFNIGSQSKVSEVLRRKRPLSITMIRNLHEGLSIPAATLIQAPGKAMPAAG